MGDAFQTGRLGLVENPLELGWRVTELRGVQADANNMLTPGLGLLECPQRIGLFKPWVASMDACTSACALWTGIDGPA